MNVQSKSKPVEQVVAAIEALDLEPIKFKLMDPEEGQGWSKEYVERMAIAYKRFLTLLVTHPETTVAPSKDIDKFWHGHILDTMKYAEDCEQVFGYFLHHFPYFGMRGVEDAVQQAQADKDMPRTKGEGVRGANAADREGGSRVGILHGRGEVGEERGVLHGGSQTSDGR